MKRKNIIGIFIILILVALGGIIFWYKQDIQGLFISKDINEDVSTVQSDTQNFVEPSMTDKEELLAGLQKAAEQEDYETLGDLLKEAYAKQYMGEEDFKAAESKAYVKATDIFQKGDTQKALDISTSIYNKAFEGWRFRYLRVVALEKLGRQALDQKDLDGAEEYAQTILRMTFRPEGADLMADIYIARINDALEQNDIQKARSLYAYVKAYDVSPIPKKKLDELAKKIQ